MKQLPVICQSIKSESYSVFTLYHMWGSTYIRYIFNVIYRKDGNHAILPESVTGIYHFHNTIRSSNTVKPAADYIFYIYKWATTMCTSIINNCTCHKFICLYTKEYNLRTWMHIFNRMYLSTQCVHNNTCRLFDSPKIIVTKYNLITL